MVALKKRIDGWTSLLTTEPVPSAPLLALRNQNESAPAIAQAMKSEEVDLALLAPV